MLIIAIAILGVAVVAGGWLGAQVLMLELPPPAGVNWRGLAHGATGVAGFAVLVVALRSGQITAHALRMGAGSFGRMAGALIAGGVLAGGLLLVMQLRRRPVSTVLIATHGLLGIVGYTLLMTYLTMQY